MSDQLVAEKEDKKQGRRRGSRKTNSESGLDLGLGGGDDLSGGSVKVLAEEEDLFAFGELLRELGGDLFEVSLVFKLDGRDGDLDGLLDLLLRSFILLDERSRVESLETCERGKEAART
jgi:hypothetical protein